MLSRPGFTIYRRRVMHHVGPRSSLWAEFDFDPNLRSIDHVAATCAALDLERALAVPTRYQRAKFRRKLVLSGRCLKCCTGWLPSVISVVVAKSLCLDLELPGGSWLSGMISV